MQSTNWSTADVVWPSASISSLHASTSDPRLGSTTAFDASGALVEVLPAPTQLLIRSPIHGNLTFDNLAAEETVGALKQKVIERLRMPPSRQVHLSSWGLDLPDDQTLRQCRLKTNSMLDMRVALVRVDDSVRTTLERVRVMSTALETQLFCVDRSTTTLDLKRKIESHLARGEHEWFNSKGERTTAFGTTVLAASAQKADEKAGTSQVSLGEQLVTTTPYAGEGKGKPINVFRVRKGQPALVNDNSVVPLALPPEKQTLSFAGRQISDEATLWAMGVRQDDAIMLEFASPVMPPILQVLRAPDKPKGEKKGKGGGGKGKKKK